MSWAIFGEEGDFAPAAAANRELFVEGLRKANLPLCATTAQLAKYPHIRRLPEGEAGRARAAAVKP